MTTTTAAKKALEAFHLFLSLPLELRIHVFQVIARALLDTYRALNILPSRTKVKVVMRYEHLGTTAVGLLHACSLARYTMFDVVAREWRRWMRHRDIQVDALLIRCEGWGGMIGLYTVRCFHDWRRDCWKVEKGSRGGLTVADKIREDWIWCGCETDPRW